MNNDNHIKKNYERRLFNYGLLLASALLGAKLIYNILLDSSTFVLTANIILLGILLALYRINRHYSSITAGIFYGLILLDSLLLWNNTGGWLGVIPFHLLALIVLIILSSHGWLQYTYLTLCGLFIFALLNNWLIPYPLTTNPNYDSLAHSWDFLSTTLALVLFVEFIKSRFYENKEAIESINQYLEASTKTIQEQTEQLNAQQHELSLIQFNLQEIVASKIQEEQDKSNMLTDFAFVNAHKVRAPLARVLGLINLLEMENTNLENQAQLNKIRQKAEEMDEIIKRINEVVN